MTKKILVILLLFVFVTPAVAQQSTSPKVTLKVNGVEQECDCKPKPATTPATVSQPKPPAPAPKAPEKVVVQPAPTSQEFNINVTVPPIVVQAPTSPQVTAMPAPQGPTAFDRYMELQIAKEQKATPPPAPVVIQTPIDLTEITKRQDEQTRILQGIAGSSKHQTVLAAIDTGANVAGAIFGGLSYGQLRGINRKMGGLESSIKGMVPPTVITNIGSLTATAMGGLGGSATGGTAMANPVITASGGVSTSTSSATGGGGGAGGAGGSSNPTFNNSPTITGTVSPTISPTVTTTANSQSESESSSKSTSSANNSNKIGINNSLTTNLTNNNNNSNQVAVTVPPPVNGGHPDNHPPKKTYSKPPEKHDGKDKKGKGNNGIGNGYDPQPPGNPPVNDGPGTLPGKPGGSHKK